MMVVVVAIVMVVVVYVVSLVVSHLGHFWCPVVTLVTFSRTLVFLKRIIKKKLKN